MAWTAPRTWVTGETVTAALMNTHVRDNLNETAAAKVTTQGDIVYATGANTLTRYGLQGNDKFLRGSSTQPIWSNQLLGPMILGVEGSTDATLTIHNANRQLFLNDRQLADPADAIVIGHNAGRMQVEYYDDSAATYTEMLDVDSGDYILHTGKVGTGTGAVQMFDDNDQAVALTTTGSNVLTTGSVTTGGPAYVLGWWTMRLGRDATGSATDTVFIAPRNDGSNITSSMILPTSSDLVPESIPSSGDSTTISGFFYQRFTATDTSTYTLFCSATADSVFSVDDVFWLVQVFPYPN